MAMAPPSAPPPPLPSAPPSTASAAPTAVQTTEATQSAERRVRPSSLTSADVLSVLGAASGSLGLVWLLYERVLPLSGAPGFLLCWYAAFLALYWGIARSQWEPRHVREKLATVVLTGAGALVVGLIVDQIGYVAVRGASAVGHGNFLTSDMKQTGPLDPLTSGGVLHGVVGTAEQLGLATLFAVPLGFAAAVFMSEVGGRFAKPVRTVVEAMTALPSIVAGLFILGSFILTLGFDRTGLAASLALTVMMMPIVTRAAEVVIRLVPNTLREASYALGGSQWRTVWNVVLPTARSGLVTAVLLGMARGVGETSPVLLTAGFSPRTNADPFHDQQVSLPLYIWSYVRYPQADMKARAFGAALTLMTVVLILFVSARLLGGRRAGELSRPRLRLRLRHRRSAGSRAVPKPARGKAAPSTARAAVAPILVPEQEPVT